MRKGGAHSARRKKSKITGKRGHDVGAFLLALGVFAVIVIAASYDFAHEQRPQAAASAPSPAIAQEGPASITIGAPGQAIAKEAIEPAAHAATAPIIEEQSLKKEDRLITGSIPAVNAIAPPAIDLKAHPQAEKKKKPGTATAKAEPKSGNGLFLSGPTLSPPN